MDTAVRSPRGTQVSLVYHGPPTGKLMDVVAGGIDKKTFVVYFNINFKS
jgi:hypothetical protein